MCIRDRLIFGAIKDESLSGKMRVSIVATALDGETPESRSVVNMVHRIHNRNTGYSENNFSTNNNIPVSPSLETIQGATALKLDNEIKTELEPIHESKQEATSTNDLETGVSLDNAAYLENNINQEHTHKDEVQEEVVIDDISIYEEKPAENLETNSNEVPQLFSDEVNPSTSSEDNLSENLKNEEEEFEIPAFLRKQKF